MRICVIGDELITSMGDPRGLGWVGRVLARSHFPSPPTVMTLAVPGETTTQLASRWENEVSYRLAPDEPCALIIAVGCADIPAGISTPRSRLNLANITDRASTLGIPSMVVGPPPLAGVQSSAVKEVSVSLRTWLLLLFVLLAALRCLDSPAMHSWLGLSCTRVGLSGRERPRRTCEHRRNVCTHVIHVSPPRDFCRRLLPAQWDHEGYP